jgi:2-phospho-L-lactate/phosphoenolpyruvate guanylyltransferase
MSIQILIGLKLLSSAKQRLMPQLSLAERRSMMITMLTTVAGAARESHLGPVALATSEPAAPSLASALDVDVVSDGGLPWNEGLMHALDRVGDTPPAVLYLAGDLPLLRAHDLLAFVDAAPASGVAVARARDLGSNALLVRPAHALTPMFGSPHSSQVHHAAATSRGLECRIVDIPGLALDVDTIEDARDAGLVAAFSETGPAPRRG